MKTGQLENGFRFEVDEAAMNDLEVLDDLVMLEEADEDRLDTDTLKALQRSSSKVLGKEQKQALYDHIRDEQGRVSVPEFAACFGEIIRGLGDEGKN